MQLSCYIGDASEGMQIVFRWQNVFTRLVYLDRLHFLILIVHFAHIEMRSASNTRWNGITNIRCIANSSKLSG